VRRARGGARRAPADGHWGGGLVPQAPPGSAAAVGRGSRSRCATGSLHGPVALEGVHPRLALPTAPNPSPCPLACPPTTPHRTWASPCSVSAREGDAAAPATAAAARGMSTPCHHHALVLLRNRARPSPVPPAAAHVNRASPPTLNPPLPPAHRLSPWPLPRDCGAGVSARGAAARLRRAWPPVLTPCTHVLAPPVCLQQQQRCSRTGAAWQRAVIAGRRRPMGPRVGGLEELGGRADGDGGLRRAAGVGSRCRGSGGTGNEEGGVWIGGGRRRGARACSAAVGVGRAAARAVRRRRRPGRAAGAGRAR
jgi:hypothetical protein